MHKLEIKMHPSKILAGFLLFTHCGAGICLCYLSFNQWLLFGLTLVILINLGYLLFRHVFLLGAKTIIKLQAVSPEKWLLITSQGKELAAKLTGSSYISSAILILNFIIEETEVKSSIIILVDSIPPKALRQLRTFLLCTKK
jgi:hypothetical protein